MLLFFVVYVVKTIVVKAVVAVVGVFADTIVWLYVVVYIDDVVVFVFMLTFVLLWWLCLFSVIFVNSIVGRVTVVASVAK